MAGKSDKKPPPNLEDEANEPPPVPFDDALRRILKAKPQHKTAPKPAPPKKK